MSNPKSEESFCLLFVLVSLSHFILSLNFKIKFRSSYCQALFLLFRLIKSVSNIHRDRKTLQLVYSQELPILIDYIKKRSFPIDLQPYIHSFIQRVEKVFSKEPVNHPKKSQRIIIPDRRKDRKNVILAVTAERTRNGSITPSQFNPLSHLFECLLSFWTVYFVLLFPSLDSLEVRTLRSTSFRRMLCVDGVEESSIRQRLGMFNNAILFAHFLQSKGRILLGCKNNFDNSLLLSLVTWLNTFLTLLTYTRRQLLSWGCFFSTQELELKVLIAHLLCSPSL